MARLSLWGIFAAVRVRKPRRRRLTARESRRRGCPNRLRRRRPERSLRDEIKRFRGKLAEQGISDVDMIGGVNLYIGNSSKPLDTLQSRKGAPKIALRYLHGRVPETGLGAAIYRYELEGQPGLEPRDTLLKRPISNTVPESLTEVKVLATASVFTRVLGGAAIIWSHQDDESDDDSRMRKGPDAGVNTTLDHIR
jgi:hypothetical protein